MTRNGCGLLPEGGEPFLDARPHARRRRDGVDREGQRDQTTIPGRNGGSRGGVPAQLFHKGRAFVGIEGAEYVFPRRDLDASGILVADLGHEGSPSRQSRSEARDRCSQVLIVLTGRLKRTASSSRENPS